MGAGNCDLTWISSCMPFLTRDWRLEKNNPEKELAQLKSSPYHRAMQFWVVDIATSLGRLTRSAISGPVL